MKTRQTEDSVCRVRLLKTEEMQFCDRAAGEE